MEVMFWVLLSSGVIMIKNPVIMCSRVSLENLMIIQPLKFSALYGTKILITEVATGLSLNKLIQSTPLT
jgi:hypothetical protein